MKTETELWDLPEIQMNNINSVVGTPLTPAFHTPFAFHSPAVHSPAVHSHAFHSPAVHSRAQSQRTSNPIIILASRVMEEN